MRDTPAVMQNPKPKTTAPDILVRGHYCAVRNTPSCIYLTCPNVRNSTVASTAGGVT
jgi:hypothetical protein